MKPFAAALVLALSLLPTMASAQPRSELQLETAPNMSASNLSIAIGVTSMAAGGVSLGQDSRLVLGMGAPLLALGVSDIVLGLAQRSGGLSGPEFEQRERSARMGLLVSGAALSSIGALWGSDLSVGAGVALLSHSAFRLLMQLATPRAEPRRFELGVSVLPLRHGSVTTATFAGVL